MLLLVTGQAINVCEYHSRIVTSVFDFFVNKSMLEYFVVLTKI